MTNKKEVEIRLLQSIFNILLASLMAIIGWVSLAINTRLQEIGILFVIICFIAVIFLLIVIFIIGAKILQKGKGC